MANPISCFLLIFVMVCWAAQGKAQSYHAFNGSSYAGVTAMYNNPASTTNQAYRWDVTLLGLQGTLTNTAFVINNNSLSHFNTAGVNISTGFKSRYVHANVDANLLNARYAINKKNAVAIGLRLRTYNHFNAEPFYYDETITFRQKFLHENNNVNYLDGYAIHAGWAEINANYSRVIFQSSSSYLSLGVTLSYLKSLSGAYGIFSRINYTEYPNPVDQYYFFILNQAVVKAAYSDNYLITSDNNSTSVQLHDFIAKAPSSFGLNIGAEYLIKKNLEGEDESADATNYDWKIGMSIMDIGHNSFNPIPGSFAISGPFNVTDSTLQPKLAKVKNIREVNDSLATLFTTHDDLKQKFSISLPTRLIISVDRNIGSHFFVNGELSLNFYSTSPVATLHTREINLLTVTPRWETQAWGIYMPVQYNSQGQLWVGAAVKLGPILLGLHSLGDAAKWFKTGTQTYNSGGYILLSIHPFKRAERKLSEVDCPK